jgi:hypothetical protein
MGAWNIHAAGSADVRAISSLNFLLAEEFILIGSTEKAPIRLLRGYQQR